MAVDYSRKLVIQTAIAFFDGVKTDLLTHGGVFETRLDPLRGNPRFASEVFDEIAAVLARRYSEGELDFEMADYLANAFQGELTDLIMEGWPKDRSDLYPASWEEVYLAFDAGEWDHFGRSNDPVAEYTNPQIEGFLAKIK